MIFIRVLFPIAIFIALFFLAYWAVNRVTRIKRERGINEAEHARKKANEWFDEAGRITPVSEEEIQKAREVQENIKSNIDLGKEVI